jgi:gas vesicle protein
LLGVIIGACAAACAALFYTPLAGRETREQVRTRYLALRSGDFDTATKF